MKVELEKNQYGHLVIKKCPKCGEDLNIVFMPGYVIGVNCLNCDSSFKVLYDFEVNKYFLVDKG